MKIEKNGFYKLSELKTDKIIIEDNIICFIFDDTNKSIDIELGENTRLEFYSVVENNEDYNINFIQNKNNSNLTLRILLLSKDNEKIKTKIHSILSSDRVKSDVRILSIVGNDGFVDLDGVIKIDTGIKGVDGNLVEENLFLGNSGKIKALPTLLVKSDDVKASHSCKMERVSDEQLFYLRSRGVGRENALSLMIEAKIKSLFSCISMLDNTFYEELVENIIKKIK